MWNAALAQVCVRETVCEKERERESGVGCELRQVQVRETMPVREGGSLALDSVLVGVHERETVCVSACERDCVCERR